MPDITPGYIHQASGNVTGMVARDDGSLHQIQVDGFRLNNAIERYKYGRFGERSYRKVSTMSDADATVFGRIISGGSPGFGNNTLTSVVITLESGATITGTAVSAGVRSISSNMRSGNGHVPVAIDLSFSSTLAWA